MKAWEYEAVVDECVVLCLDCAHKKYPRRFEKDEEIGSFGKQCDCCHETLEGRSVYRDLDTGATYCSHCKQKVKDELPDHLSPVFADSEWDFYPTCDVCGAVMDYVNLTTDGQRYEEERKQKDD